MNFAKTLILIVVSALITACTTVPAAPGSSASLNTRDVGSFSAVKEGRILFVEDLRISVPDSQEKVATGGAIGAIAGAGLGSHIGKGKGAKAATVVGALLGANAGSSLVSNKTQAVRQFVLEIGKEKVAVAVQNYDATLSAGDKVLVIYTNGRVTRVMRG